MFQNGLKEQPMKKDWALRTRAGYDSNIAQSVDDPEIVPAYGIKSNSCREYGWLSVMTDNISNLTKQSFPEICRNDRSLNETIYTPKCDKLHVFDMMEEMKRKSLLIEYYLYTQQNFMTQKLIHFACENY